MDKQVEVGKDIPVKCQWLTNIHTDKKVTFLWRDSRSTEKGFLPVCWRFLSGGGGCNETFIYPDHQFQVEVDSSGTVAANNDEMLIKSIKYTGDVMCEFTVYLGPSFSSTKQSVTVIGRLSRILYNINSNN